MTQVQTLSLAQDRETPVEAGRNGTFVWRYAYARSADSRAGGDPGQDYVALRTDESMFAFSVCDGVSQSFFGDLAARYLGEALVEWLWAQIGPGSTSGAVRASLAELLRALTPTGTRLVLAQPLPAGIPPMLSDVLEQKRAMGSEAAFVCGKLFAPSSEVPQGRLVLAWMGDLRLRLWGSSAEHDTRMSDAFRTFERWSTRRGPVESEPHVLVARLRPKAGAGIVEVMAYSDGLSALDTARRPPTNEDVSRLMAEATMDPRSDDMSFLSVRIESGL